MQICLENYILTARLGEGNNAIVYKGQNTNKQYHTLLKGYSCDYPQQQVAIKISNPSKNTNLENYKTFQNEAQLLSELDHPNIVSLREFKYSEDQVFIVQELAEEGELFDYVAQGAFNEVMTRTLFHQLVDGISYCHSKYIAHRDLKLENILLDRNFVLKIVDFGFAAKPDQGGLNKGFLGTEGYLAPEVWQQISYRGELVDIFACGVILFMIYMGGRPFETATMKDRYRFIMKNQIDKFWQSHSYKGQINSQFQDLINGMLAYNPKDRFTINDIKKHPWFQGEIVSQELMFQEFQMRKQNIQ